MLSWTKHGDVVQFSPLLIHDESRQHRDFSKLDGSLACAIAPMQNREENGRLANIFPSEIRDIFPSNVRCDVNEFHNGHAMFRWRKKLKKKKNLVSYTEKDRSWLFCIVILGRVEGRKFRPEYFPFLLFTQRTRPQTPFPPSRWERRGLLNQYEQYFRPLQRARARTLFLLRRTHSIVP